MLANELTYAAELAAVAVAASQAVNYWFRLKLHNDLADFRAELLDRLDQKYLPREIFLGEIARLDERCHLRRRVTGGPGGGGPGGGVTACEEEWRKSWS